MTWFTLRGAAMKTCPFCLVAAASLATVLAADLPAPTDAALVQFAQQRTNAVRVTKAPFRMNDAVAFLCNAPIEELRIAEKQKELNRPLKNPHRDKFVHVFVSPDGAPAMQTNSITFPRGSVVLKEKFADLKGERTELFTGMVKREKGYNPECGDWEFFVLGADASKVIERGRLQRCMDCHVEYKASDFVTKNYTRWGTKAR
ncbi:MAG: cytochrome P460 family protein [Verrucomicrobiota bacterium]